MNSNENVCIIIFKFDVVTNSEKIWRKVSFKNKYHIVKSTKCWTEMNAMLKL